MSEMRKAQASVVFFLVFPYKVHLLSSPHLPLCKPHTWRQSYAGAIKITIGSSPLRAIWLSCPCFLHLEGDVSFPPFPPFFSMAVKREQQGKGNAQVSRASSSSHGHPTAARSVGEELPSAWAARGMQCPWYGRQSWENRLPVCRGWPNQGREEGWVQLSPLLIWSV